MVIFPKAKINIGLRITEKRQDGYHNLQTVFYPVNLTDALEFVIPAGSLKGDILTLSGIPLEPGTGNNLVLKALELMRSEFNIPYLRIHLHKKIPAGAGLGGGSSDAAVFIKALNRYFSLQMNDDYMKMTALKLGSDCPFFIDCQPAYAQGRGEIMTPLPPLSEELILVILKPEINISTKEAFSGCVPCKNEIALSDLFKENILKWKDLISNDFENTVLKKYPEIARIKEALYASGAVYSSMTGSGSAVYGIFRSQPLLHDKLKKLIVYSGKL